MKRRFRFIVFWVLLISAIAFLAVPRISFSKIKTGKTNIPGEALARTVFLLDENHWTTFRLPSNANRLTILSRAHFSTGEADILDRNFPYTMRYRLEKLDGDIIHEGSFNLRANYIPMVDENGIPEPAAFFSDRKTVISTSRSSALELAPGELVIFRIRLESLDPAVSSVSIRAFQTREVDQNRPAYLWSRMNRRSLERIAERRVHSLTGISPDEQLNILRNRPIPLGAFGVSGSDFQQATLYIRNGLVPARRELIEPLGVGEIRCNPELRAVIGIPHQGGTIRLKIRRVVKGGNDIVTIRYFGETIYERESFQEKISRTGGEFTRHLKPGLLEIESPVAVTIFPAFQRENETEKPLEIDPALVRAWLIEEGHSATFSRNRQSRDSSFLRISARPVHSQNGTIRYTLLDDDGSTIKTGSCMIEAIPSLYDIELTSEAELPVKDPQNLILALSHKVAAVRMESDAPFLLSGYSRPSGLVHRTRVPVDYVRALPDPDRLPVWFGLRPDHAEEMMRSHRSHLLQVQTRPPVDDADILAGKYQWQDYQPINGVGQYLFRERDPNSPGRIEALPSLYAPLATGKSSPVYPESPPGLNRPSRRLAFVREGNEPVDLTLHIDGQPFFSRRLVTTCGELPLPPLPENFSSARVQSNAEGLKCFLNYINPSTATRLKRRAQRISEGDTLEFHCEKLTGEEELLTGMFFTTAHNPANSAIKVSISNSEGTGFLKESDSYTNRVRAYLIAPNPEGASTPVLGGAIPRVDSGRRFFIPFGKDMSPGTYLVNIDYQSGPGGYLTLSKVLSGEYTEARFFRDISR